jgi:alpha-beta hydrolase superfamily lysophospholipase
MDNLIGYCDFETIPLKDDYEGKVTATLIIPKTNTGKRKSILFVHGFVDYFFQLHVIQKCDEHGYDVYGLDLRKYGRSYMKHQHHCYCKSVEEYFEEIDYCIKRIKAENNQPLLLSGHSTGGLITGHYLNYGSERKSVSGLILNSPFLEMNYIMVGKIQSLILKFLYNTLPVFYPYAILKKTVPSVYGKSLHIGHRGEWEYNLGWKPLRGFPTYFMWLRAVTRAHHFLQTQSAIKVPVLLMHSEKSLQKKYVKADFHSTDIVLNVEHMKKYGPHLGNDVKLLSVKNGLHDIFLSNADARNYAFSEMFKWLEGNLLTERMELT